MLESFSHEIKTPLNGALGPLETYIFKEDMEYSIKKLCLMQTYRSL